MVKLKFEYFVSCLIQKKLLLSTDITGGHSSVVERLVANEKVEGSTPFARSNKWF